MQPASLQNPPAQLQQANQLPIQYGQPVSAGGVSLPLQQQQQLQQPRGYASDSQAAANSASIRNNPVPVGTSQPAYSSGIPTPSVSSHLPEPNLSASGSRPGRRAYPTVPGVNVPAVEPAGLDPFSGPGQGYIDPSVNPQLAGTQAQAPQFFTPGDPRIAALQSPHSASSYTPTPSPGTPSYGAQTQFGQVGGQFGPGKIDPLTSSMSAMSLNVSSYFPVNNFATLTLYQYLTYSHIL